MFHNSVQKLTEARGKNRTLAFCTSAAAFCTHGAKTVPSLVASPSIFFLHRCEMQCNGVKKKMTETQQVRARFSYMRAPVCKNNAIILRVSVNFCFTPLRNSMQRCKKQIDGDATSEGTVFVHASSHLQEQCHHVVRLRQLFFNTVATCNATV